ncbi:MAG: FkbM family methyltransferase [Candidatus ainarchaeum sp.]|nr:FkbM family methyltransferase [Candidatus ainarchaeum sp.]
MNSFIIKFISFIKGITITPVDDKVIRLTKKEKELILRKSILGKCILNFEKVFKYSKDNKINLTKKYFEINFSGKTITTDFEQVKEIDDAILKYNIYYKLKSGDIVFDLGGYHGVYSLWASTLVGPLGKVYCFEPDPINFEILKENIEKNNITNIILINKAISNKNQTQRFFIRGHGSRIVDEAFKTNTKGALCTIPSIPLSQFIKEKNITKIDFIKADIEGAEIEFVDDYLKNILPLGITPHLAIASYHYRKDLGTNTSKQIAKEFKKNGIKVNIGNKKHECVFV